MSTVDLSKFVCLFCGVLNQTEKKTVCDGRRKYFFLMIYAMAGVKVKTVHTAYYYIQAE